MKGPLNGALIKKLLRPRWRIVARGKDWNLKIEFKPQYFWVGVLYKPLYCMGYEMDPKFPVKYTEHGTAYQRESLDVYICLVPCFPVHYLKWRR